MSEALRADDYQRRKQARRDCYLRFVHGWKLRPCAACSGSGRYDHHNGPKCGACNGTDKERYKPDIVPPSPQSIA